MTVWIHTLEGDDYELTAIVEDGEVTTGEEDLVLSAFPDGIPSEEEVARSFDGPLTVSSTDFEMEWKPDREADQKAESLTVEDLEPETEYRMDTRDLPEGRVLVHGIEGGEVLLTHETVGYAIVPEGDILEVTPVDGGADEKAVPDNAVSIDSRDEAPEGAQVIEGDRGGLYYVPEGDGGGGGTDSVSEVLADEYGVEADLSATTPEAAKEVGDGVARLREKFPEVELSTSVTAVDSDEGRTSAAGYDPDADEVQLYDAVDDPEEYAELIEEKNQDSRELNGVDGLATSTVGDVVVHEFGHAFESRLTEDSREQAREIFGDFDGDYDPYDGDGAANEDLAREVSLYASLDPAEFFAESFYVYVDEGPDALPDPVAGFFEEEMEVDA